MTTLVETLPNLFFSPPVNREYYVTYVWRETIALIIEIILRIWPVIGVVINLYLYSALTYFYLCAFHFSTISLSVAT
jgi:hypothetical protein